MGRLKVIGNVILILLAAAALCMCLVSFYYHYFVHNTTIGVNNVNDQEAIDITKADDLTTEEKSLFEKRWFMEANYYSNSKKNGIELQELKFNYFEGLNLTESEYRSTGMQYIGNFENYVNNSNSEEEANKRILDEFFYYDTTLGINWSGIKGQDGGIGTKLNREQLMNIKIDDRLFGIRLDGKKVWTSGVWPFNRENILTYDYGTVFDRVFRSIKSNDQGYGDYFIKVDLSQYFTILEYDLTTKKFKEDNVTDIIKNYAVLKFHYNENGAVSSNQSLYNIIECNPKYNLSGGDIDPEFWKEEIVYNFNEYDLDKYLNYEFKNEHQGMFISFNDKFRSLFNKDSKVKINIEMDLNSSFFKQRGMKILGISEGGFKGIKIDNLTLRGEGIFKVLDQALYDTNLKTLQKVKTLIINLEDTAINSTYKEVIL